MSGLGFSITVPKTHANPNKMDDDVSDGIALSHSAIRSPRDMIAILNYMYHALSNAQSGDTIAEGAMAIGSLTIFSLSDKLVIIRMAIRSPNTRWRAFATARPNAKTEGNKVHWQSE